MSECDEQPLITEEDLVFTGEQYEIHPDKIKELMSKRIRPVFSTKRYRKVVTRNPRTGEWEVTYILKRKKTWTSQSQAGFEKACQIRAEKCKARKQNRMEGQIKQLQDKLEELKGVTLEEEEREQYEGDFFDVAGDSPLDMEVETDISPIPSKRKKSPSPCPPAPKKKSKVKA
jgi:hypothetical protein